MLALSPQESLVCIEVPGRVENPDRLIQMVGGINNLSKTLGDKSRRLELRFRPDDPHCKPACGERVPASSYLLKVKVLRRRKKNDDGEDEIKLVSEIVAPVSTTIKFSNLCDFQFLPAVKKQTDSSSTPTYESILSFAQLKTLCKSEYWCSKDGEKDVPLFLPPAAFSRMDTPQDYHFRRDATNQKAISQMPHNIIGRTRQRRSHHAIFVMYDVEQVPDRPKEDAKKQMKVKFIENRDKEIVNGLFQEHPVWSKTALVATTGMSAERLKFIIPTEAYYFTTGPWRNFWVRLGYDPRKDRSAAKYQSLDYRVRVEGGITHKVKAKRNYASYLLPYKGTNWSKPKTSLIHYGGNENVGNSKEEKSNNSNENLYLFKPGMIPPHRQTFYMYKDILITEAQDLMAENLKPEGATCDEKNGWFNPGVDSKLREILTKEIKKVILEENALAESEGEDDDN